MEVARPCLIISMPTLIILTAISYYKQYKSSLSKSNGIFTAINNPNPKSTYTHQWLLILIFIFNILT